MSAALVLLLAAGAGAETGEPAIPDARIASRVRGVSAVVDRVAVRAGPRPDDEIRADVSSALAAHPVIHSHELAVSVREGVVALGGTVASGAVRDLASAVAAGVRGARDVEDRIRVRPQAPRGDREMRREIAQRLRWDARLDSGLVRVEVRDGKVALNGSVGSAFERRLARDLAWVPGAVSVDESGLQVQWWARDEMRRGERWRRIRDEEIAEALALALRYDPRVGAPEPSVEVRGGAVTLRGSVESAGARRAAARSARNTVGVWRVDDQIQVRAAERSDRAIAADVRAALDRDPRVERYGLAVSTRGGSVSLAGQVDSHFDRSHAAEIASRVRGVPAVENDLELFYELPVYGAIGFPDDVPRPPAHGRDGTAVAGVDL